MERGIIISFQGIRIYQERIRIKSNLAPGLGGVLCGRYVGGTSEVRRLRSLYLSINGKSAFSRRNSFTKLSHMRYSFSLVCEYATNCEAITVQMLLLTASHEANKHEWWMHAYMILCAWPRKREYGA